MLGQRSDRRSLLTAMCLVMVLVVPTGAYADEWTNRPVEELVRLAREGDFGVRYQAVVALGKLGGPLAQRTLVSSLGDSHWRIRWRATEGLAKIGDLAAVRDLLLRLGEEVESEEALKTSGKPPVRVGYVGLSEFLQRQLGIAIRDIMVRHADRPDARAVRDDLARVMLDASEKQRVRSEIALVLGELGDRRSIPVLLDVLQHEPSGALRAFSAKALGNLRAVEARAALVAALDDPYETPGSRHIRLVRNAATRALKQLDSK